MGRWEPDAKGRLQKAALELYAERGFDETTVAEIAARAGLTERTFFRHYADKREVLFAGSSILRDTLVEAVLGAPEATRPFDVVAGALEALSPMFDGRRDGVRLRQEVVAANPELQERELIKMASLGSDLAGALRRRGWEDPAAALAAEAGIAVFRVAFERWVSGAAPGSLAGVIRDSADQLRAVAAG